MSHKRGEIVESISFTGNKFYKVFIGCQWLDDYYTVDTYKHALQIQTEMLDHYNSGAKVSP
jgi:hypothetical protein